MCTPMGKRCEWYLHQNSSHSTFTCNDNIGLFIKYKLPHSRGQNTKAPLYPYGHYFHLPSADIPSKYGLYRGLYKQNVYVNNMQVYVIVYVETEGWLHTIWEYARTHRQASRIANANALVTVICFVIATHT